MGILTLNVARSRNSFSVTVLGLVTLLLGGCYTAFACSAILAGAEWFAHPSQEPMMQVVALGGIVPGLIIAFGVAFLPLGLLGLLAGVGTLLRKRWGRILTFVLAVPAILLGLLLAGGSDLDATAIAIGGAQVLYGILAFVTLFMNGAEFSRPRVGAKRPLNPKIDAKSFAIPK